MDERLMEERQLYDLVVVGPSTEDHESLAKFTASLPADLPVPIVVSMYSNSTRPSRLAGPPAAPHAPPVRRLTGRKAEPLLPGHLYVVPADGDVEIAENVLRLRDAAGRRRKPSLRRLLRNAARSYGPRLLAVIPAGAGADGAAGAREVKRAGGTVIVTRPTSGAPRALPAALAPMTADLVAEPERIGTLLTGLLRRLPLPAHAWPPRLAPPRGMRAVDDDVAVLNDRMAATVDELRAANAQLRARLAEARRVAQAHEEQRLACERERARLAAVLSAISESLVVMDAQGHAVVANRAYRQLFGEPGATPALRDADGHPLPPAPAPQRWASSGVPFTSSFTLADPDGPRRWYEAHGEPIYSDDVLLGSVVSIRDLTDRHLRRLEEQFVAAVNHELRGPLTVIQIALESAEQTLTPAQRHRLGRRFALAHQQMGKLGRLADDLADTEHIRRGGMQVTPRPMDLAATVRQAVEGLALASLDDEERPPIALHAPPEGGPLRIDGDPVRVEQMVTNLVTNAIKYARTSERIDVRVRRVGEEAHIEVQDYGPGIAADDLPHIFTAFYQADSQADPARRRERTSLGLGLFITRSLARAHGGEVDVRSETGRGTTFTVRLPLPPAGAGMAASAGAPLHARPDPLD